MALRPSVAGRSRARADASPKSETNAEYERRRRERSAWRAWYGTARWRAKRAEQLASEPLCRRCAASGVVTAARVCDHVEPHRGDPELFWNGPTQSLCDNCHNEAKQREERAATVRPR